MVAVSLAPDSLDAAPLFTGLDVSAEEWAATPAPVRRGVQRLWEELQRLREQVGKTSQNSSKPPSSDPPSAPKRAAKAHTGRHAGGQPCHADTNRALVPADQLKRPPIPCHPATCHHCGHALSAADCPAPPHRHQVIDIPPVVADIIEYQLYTATCPCCGQDTPAALPAGVPAGGYGPVVTAMVTTLTGLYHLSKRAVSDLLGTFFQVPISEATVQHQEQTMSAALQAPWQEVHAAVQAADAAHLDETGWYQQRDPDPPAAEAEASASPAPAPAAPPDKLHKAWLWVAVCQGAILFLIRRSRGRQVVKELLGPLFAGILITDRWHAYNWVATARRQLCWAHLLRDFTAISERSGVAHQIGTAILAQADAMFALWFRVRDGTLPRPDFQQAMVPIQATVSALLKEGAATASKPTSTTCQWLVEHEAALWTFVRIADIDPTNNRAEQAIRAAVIWRKLCFGTQTSAGSRYVERVLTVVATCRLQQRPVLAYLTAVATAVYAGNPTPTLLPIAPQTT
jgi:transposase